MGSPETPDATYCCVWFHVGNPEAASCVSCDMVLTAPLDYHLFLLLNISTNLISILASFLFLGSVLGFQENGAFACVSFGFRSHAPLEMI